MHSAWLFSNLSDPNLFFLLLFNSLSMDKGQKQVGLYLTDTEYRSLSETKERKRNSKLYRSAIKT